MSQVSYSANSASCFMRQAQDLSQRCEVYLNSKLALHYLAKIQTVRISNRHKNQGQ